ncbi:hypothetical protein TU57_18380, partial [Bacillus cereus]|uniref:hypothetical protein n=1 Tax=Bacillus cereus TaxID=1396 RepID=UPI00065BF85A
EATEHSSHRSWISFKAEAARSEQELYIKQNPYYSTVIGIFIYTVHNLFKLIPAKGLIYTNY